MLISKRKICLAVLLVLAIAFSGCQNKKKDIKSTATTSNIKTVVNSKKKYEIVNKNSIWEYRYYSPDKKNYIRGVIIPEINYEILSMKPYLNSSDKLLFDERFLNDVTNQDVDNKVIWLNNNEVLFDLYLILNIKENSIKKIDLSKILGKGSLIHSYHINKEKNKIAYAVYNEVKESIFVYDMIKDTYELIWEEDAENFTTVPFHIYWDSMDNLYFDTWETEFNDSRIYKFGYEDKSMSLYKQGYVLSTCSPNYKYLGFFNYNDSKDNGCKYIITDIEKGSDLFSFYGGIMTWSDDSSKLANYHNGKIYILSMPTKNVSEEIDLNEIIAKDESGVSNIYYLDYFDEHFFFFSCMDHLNNYKPIGKGDIYMVID